ncbi:MAG: hypothetical protein ABJD68_12080 [Nakamurella sp.]
MVRVSKCPADQSDVMTGSAASDLFITGLFLLIGCYALVMHIRRLASGYDSRLQHEYIQVPGEPRKDDPRDFPRPLGRG